MKLQVLKRNTLILSSLLLVMAGCKKADDTAGSTDSVTTTNSTANTVSDVPQKTIDAKGGTLSLGIFQVEIPQNAITTATSISLTKSAERPFGTSQKSDIFYINNLPDVIDQPIVMSLSGFTAADKITTYLVESTFVPSLNKETVGYRPVSNSLVNGQLQVTLPANTNNKSLELKAGTNPIAVGFLAVTGRSSITSVQGHFRLTFLSTVVNDAIDLATNLEDAYNKFSTSPISLSYANRTIWPVEVDLSILSDNVYGEMISSLWGNNYSYLCFNDNKLSNKAEMKITAGHEFLHLVQGLYDPRNRYSKAKIAAPQLWIDEATAVWAESLFTTNTGYISTVRAGNEMSPYQALMKGADTGASTYGYGMSSMVKYLVAQLGSGIIKKIYDQILAGQKPAEAIRLATGKSYYEWYGYFLENCTLGKVYNDIPISGLVGNKTDGFTVATANDTVKQFDSSFGQMQSRIYMINLTESAIAEGSSFNFLVKSPDTELITVYKYTSGSIEKIGQDLKYVLIPDIKAIARAGYKIMVVVTNQKYDYISTANQNISLIARIKAPKLFTKLSVEFGVTTLNSHETNYDAKGNIVGQRDYTSGSHIRIEMVPCTQNANVVTASWNGTYSYQLHKGSATITLNPVNNTLSFSISDECTENSASTGNTTTTVSGSASDIPLWGSGPVEYKDGNDDSNKRWKNLTVKSDMVSSTNRRVIQSQLPTVAAPPQYGNSISIKLYYN